MSKYSPLWQYISSKNLYTITITFEEIKNILGFEIDHSFLNFKKELLDYGFIISKISLKNKYIIFEKSQTNII